MPISGLEVQRGFVHVQLGTAFDITLPAMRQLWQAVVPACEQHSLRRVLIERNSPSRSMQNTEVYQHGKIVADIDLQGL